MIRAGEQRVGGWALLFAVTITTVAGCSRSTGTGNAKVKVKAGDSHGVVDGSSTGSNKLRSDEFASNFLKALSAGKADPELLTVSFKKKIARPRPGNEDDRKIGYNPLAVESYLKKYGEGAYDEHRSNNQTTSGPIFFGKVKAAGGQSELYVLHLVPSDEASGWKIDWFHRTSAKGPAYQPGAQSTEINGAMLAAHLFLDNLLGGELLLAESLLARSWKIDNYGSKNPSDAELGYNQALVLQKLRGWKNNFNEFSFSKHEAAAGNPAIFEGVLTNAASKEMKAFTFKVIKGEGDEWFVDAIDIK